MVERQVMVLVVTSNAHHNPPAATIAKNRAP
jgi:hypothetical protein